MGWGCTGVLVWLYRFQLFSCFLSPLFHIPLFFLIAGPAGLPWLHNYHQTQRQPPSKGFFISSQRGPNLWINPLFHIINSGFAFLTELCMIHSYARDSFLLQHLCPGYSLCMEALLSDYIMTNSLTSFNYSLHLFKETCLNQLLKISVFSKPPLNSWTFFFSSFFVLITKYYTSKEFTKIM